MLLDAEPDLRVVAQACDGAAAVTAGPVEDIDLAILDVAMPRMNGLYAAGELKRRHPEIRFLILSMHENEQYLYEALKAGASAMSSRPSPTATLSRLVARRCVVSRSCTRGRPPH
jgi:DNA-binding NarL/FixJ family response regulator